MTKAEVESRIGQVVRSLLEVQGRACGPLRPSSQLAADLGLSSDDGVLLVLDLCDEFRIELAPDYNPAGPGGTFAGLVRTVWASVSASESAK